MKPFPLRKKPVDNEVEKVFCFIFNMLCFFTAIKCVEKGENERRRREKNGTEIYANNLMIAGCLAAFPLLTSRTHRISR